MSKRKRVSGNIKFKKYFLSWFILVVAYVMTTYFITSGFWNYFTWIISILIAITFFSLKKVEFDSNSVFFDGKKVNFESIKSIKDFEINHQPYYLFITDSKKIFKKYYLTQLGGLNYFSIIKALLFNKKDAAKWPIAEFLHLLDTK